MIHVLRVAFLAVSVLGAGCSELGNGTGQISQRIGEITHDPSSREVDLSKLTTFGWDRLHYLKPGTSREDICKFVGANRNSCGRVFRYTSVPSDHLVLLFSLNGRLTHTELHALDNGQFDFATSEEGVPRDHCVFRIRRSASGTTHDSIWLEPR